jgi:hypothetical protein
MFVLLTTFEIHSRVANSATSQQVLIFDSFCQYRILISLGCGYATICPGSKSVYPGSFIYLFILSLVSCNISSNGLIPTLLSFCSGAKLANNLVGPIKLGCMTTKGVPLL